MGVEVGEERPCNAPGFRATGASNLPGRALSAPAGPERLLSDEELELRGACFVANSLALVTAPRPRSAGRERDVVAGEGIPAVLHHEAPVAEPEEHLAAGESLLAVDPPMLETGVAEFVELRTK